MRTDLDPNSKGSFALLGLDHLFLCTHGLRRGLYSYAALRLESGGAFIRCSGRRCSCRLRKKYIGLSASLRAGSSLESFAVRGGPLRHDDIGWMFSRVGTTFPLAELRRKCCDCGRRREFCRRATIEIARYFQR
jgi:hypothetical protein